MSSRGVGKLSRDFIEAGGKAVLFAESAHGAFTP